jgi:hypothetical protein
LKAEVFSSDFIVGLSVFLIAISIFGIYYTNIQNDIVDYKIRNDMQTKADSVANLLATNSGDPEFWNSNSVKIIGLQDSNIINLTKFEELKKIDYFVAKRMLGVGGYEFYIELKNETGYTLRNGSSVFSYGKEMTEDSLNVFYTERYGLTRLNNVTKVILGVAIWL